jgi:hypothetical protein
MMREFMVARMCCADCGHVLEFAHQSGDTPRPESVRDGITGAAKIETVWMVKPCPTCIGKLRRAAKGIKAGLNLLTSEAER